MKRTERRERRMWMVLLLAVLSLTASSFSQMRNMAEDETIILKNAKKVSVYINLGPTQPAPYEPNYDRAKKQVSEKLKKLRLELVPDASQADLVLVVTEYNQSSSAVMGQATAVGGTALGNAHELICLCDRLDIFKGGKAPADGDSPIWSKTETCGYSWPLNRTFDKLEKVLKKK